MNRICYIIKFLSASSIFDNVFINSILVKGTSFKLQTFIEEFEIIRLLSAVGALFKLSDLAKDKMRNRCFHICDMHMEV